MNVNRKLPLVDATRFSMVPRSDVPRSTFTTQHSRKSTFDLDYLVPVYVDEVLPGDVHHGEMTFFARLATPIFPIMDNICVESFFFFVPSRILWANWKKFMGEQANPADSIAYTVPQVVSAAGGFLVGSVWDHFGLPTVGQVGGTEDVSVNALPARAYNLIYNEWFRDENLQLSQTTNVSSDGPDTLSNYQLQKRGKRHDYFTSCLPWPLKGGVDVTLPLGTTAPVTTSGTADITTPQNALKFRSVATGGLPPANRMAVNASGFAGYTATAEATTQVLYPSNLIADLSSASAASINTIRLAVTTQQFLEKDARGGTRYTELLQNHFGVLPEDFRLQRPEYIGGGKDYIKTQAIPQTSATAGGGTLGLLGATALGSSSHPFRYMAKEHGYIIGLVNVTGDITYQQGLHKMWSRSTRYDFYWPAFANLGEQAVKRQELYCTGAPANDDVVFGYQERWAEYRYRPSQITGLFRSTSASNIDEWHLAEQFGSAPSLNSTFIVQATPYSRVAAAGGSANGQQVLWDSVFNVKSTRPVPVHSVPGLVRF